MYRVRVQTPVCRLCTREVCRVCTREVCRVSSHRVVQLLQTGDGEEVVDVDAVLNQKFNEVDPVQHQSVHHGLFQWVHLSHTKTPSWQSHPATCFWCQSLSGCWWRLFKMITSLLVQSPTQLSSSSFRGSVSSGGSGLLFPPFPFFPRGFPLAPPADGRWANGLFGRSEGEVRTGWNRKQTQVRNQ